MIISLTCLRLRSPLKIPALIRYSRSIFDQLESTDCVSVKTRGIWKNHYTMTQWDSYEDLEAFASSGAHKEAIKMSKGITEEVLFLSMECDDLPAWSEVRQLLKSDGQVYHHQPHW